MRVLAELYQPVTGETPHGGWSVTHEPVGVVWLTPGRKSRRLPETQGTAEIVETMQAKARDDPRLIEGRLLRFGGADWTILDVDTTGGLAGLKLERRR